MNELTLTALKFLHDSVGSFFGRFNHYNSQRLQAEHDVKVIK